MNSERHEPRQARRPDEAGKGEPQAAGAGAAPIAEPDAALRLLVSRRGDLVVDRTRRQARLHDLLASV